MRVQFTAGADRLTWAYPNLSPQLKKCAVHILEHPSEVATLSMRQVAARAGVPPSTLNRLARALGFGTYNEFRDLYRNSINNVSDGWSRRPGPLRAIDGTADLDHAVDAFQQSALLNLRTLYEQLDRVVLDRTVRALALARSVLVVGMLKSYSAANYLHCVAATGLRSWHLVDHHNGELPCLLEPLSDADAVVGISLEPWAADAITVVRRARARGARVIGITDRRTSPLAACSDDILLVPNRGPSFFRSYVAVTAVVEMLAGMVVARSGSSATERIDRTENSRRELGAYWEG